MPLTVGQRVGAYTIEAVIGAGATAAVYRARDAADSVFALKMLTVQDDGLEERLRLEGRLQQELTHSNVVGVHETVDHDGMPVLVLEYVEGPSLDALLASHVPSLEDALTLFGGILKGVAAAHARGVTHRDLKPGNVLLHDTPSGIRPRVADFGLAKVIDPDGRRRRTMSGISLGTPGYMAPEQFVDAKRVTPAADLFSLGCLLYRLTCGIRPFPGSNAVDVQNAIAEGRYTDPREHQPGLPAVVSHAIEACLRVDPTERVASVGELAEMVYGDAPIPGVLAHGRPTAEAVAELTRSHQRAELDASPERPQVRGWEHAPPLEPADPRRRAIGCGAALVVTTALAAAGVLAATLAQP